MQGAPPTQRGDDTTVELDAGTAVNVGMEHTVRDILFALDVSLFPALSCALRGV